MYNVHEASEMLQISADTIRRWEKKGLIKSKRNDNNHRIFNLDEIKRVQSKYLSTEPEGRYKIHKSKKTEYTAIELFSGAGGLALGLENAGFNAKLLVEIDKNAVATLQANRPKWNAIQGDVTKIDFKEYRDKIDLVAGGFPCQAFSFAGNSKGFEDTRGTLFFDFARCVQEVRPKIALGENVKGLLKHDNGKTLSKMISVLDGLGYNVEFE